MGLPKREGRDRREMDASFSRCQLAFNGVDRDKLREQLASKGVPAMIYYPVPLHVQKAFADERNSSKEFPVENLLLAFSRDRRT